MTASGWIQLGIFVAALLALTKPMGLYLLRVLDPSRAGGGTFLEPVVGPIERLIYRLLRIDPKREQGWKQYAVAMLIFFGRNGCIHLRRAEISRASAVARKCGCGCQTRQP